MRVVPTETSRCIQVCQYLGAQNTSIKINTWIPGVYYIMVDNGRTKEFSKLVVE